MKKSFMTRMLAVSLSAAMTFSLSSASSLTATEAAAKKLPANNKAVSISLKVGNSKVLKLKNYKAWNIKKGATNKKAVAAVANKGTAAKRTIKVTAKKKGTAKVTLTLGKRKTADSKTTKYSKTIKKVVTVKVKAADTTTPTDATDTTPTDTTTPTTPSTTTGSATNVTPGVLHISQASATHADTIAVSFSSIVASQAAVKVTVTRGESTNPIEGKFSWGAGAQGGEFKSATKLSKGTYTVTATDGKDTTTATVEIAEAQEVKKIEFIGDTALTGRGDDDTVGREAFVYYDLKDQYGDSVRDQFSVQWTSSAEVKHVDRATGRITLRKNNNDNKEVFTYADKIYVTGVYTKTGVTNSGTFSVGTEQSVDTIKLWGFVKKGTSEKLETLPKDFKSNEYQLLYDAFDQNGNQMEADDYLYDSSDEKKTRSLTFVSDNVLIIKELLNNDGRSVTVNGTEYCAANVVPGINVNAGGTVNLSAIATKTGKKSDISVLVGNYRILKKFELQAPTGYVVDGESVEIPFLAEDAEGNRITLFKELATQSNFSKLTLNESVGQLVLSERDDGSAKLVWSDVKDGVVTSEGAWGSSSTNDIERPVSLTAIVVGGETSNELIQVSDKARPEGISNLDISSVLVADKDQEINYGKFTFIDQYGRNMKQTVEVARKDQMFLADGFSQVWKTDGSGELDYAVYDNGFFEYVNSSDTAGLSGSDFRDYKFGINVSLVGLTNGSVKNNWTGFTYGDSTNEIVSFTTSSGIQFSYGQKLRYEAQEVSGKIPETTVKCAIQKIKPSAKNPEVEDVSKKYSTSFKVAPLDRLSNWKIGNLDKFHIVTSLSSKDNGQRLADVSGDNTLNIPVTAASKLNIDTVTKSAIDAIATYSYIDIANSQDVKVFGYYNGAEVEIPAGHYALDNGGALLTKDNEWAYALGSRNISRVLAGTNNNVTGLYYKDLYDISTAHFNPKDANVDIIANVYATGTSQAAITAEPDKNKVTTVKYTAQISDSDSQLSVFEGADTFTIKPSFTNYELRDLVTSVGNTSYAYASGGNDHKIVVKDQYNKELYFVDANEWLLVRKDEGRATYKGDLDSNGIKFEYLVKDIVENKDGFVEGNFRVEDNASQNTVIKGAELGDTFTVEIKAYVPEDCEALVGSKGEVTKVVKVTVGADTGCYILDNDNYYSDTNSTINNDGQIELVTWEKNGRQSSVRENLQYQLNELLGLEGNKKK